MENVLLQNSNIPHIFYFIDILIHFTIMGITLELSNYKY